MTEQQLNILLSDKSLTTIVIIDQPGNTPKEVYEFDQVIDGEAWFNRVGGTDEDWWRVKLPNPIGTVEPVMEEWAEDRRDGDTDPYWNYITKAMISEKIYDNFDWQPASTMPDELVKHTKVTGVEVKRVQEIKPEVLGLGKYNFDTGDHPLYHYINATYGSGTWESNPYVAVETRELING